MTAEPEPSELLVRALESLSADERQAVTSWLLRQFTPTAAVSGTGAAAIVSSLVPPSVGTELAKARLGEWPEVRRAVAGQLTGGEESQLVTIRMPAEQHARLRDWCAEHQFTMAAVIRGLVERFLDRDGRA